MVEELFGATLPPLFEELGVDFFQGVQATHASSSSYDAVPSLESDPPTPNSPAEEDEGVPPTPSMSALAFPGDIPVDIDLTNDIALAIGITPPVKTLPATSLLGLSNFPNFNDTPFSVSDSPLPASFSSAFANFSSADLGSLFPPADSTPAPTPSTPSASLPRRASRGKTPSLVPLDAPTQKRKYVLPSATSKKEVPAIAERLIAREKKKELKRSGHEVTPEEGNEEVRPKKRGRPPSRSNSLDSMTAEAAASTLKDGEVPEAIRNAIESKRRQNTMAARKSRLRKQEELKELQDKAAVAEAERDRLAAELAVWKQRAEAAESALELARAVSL